VAWTGAVAKAHCDVISAETYLTNAVRTLEKVNEEERWDQAVAYLDVALTTIGFVIDDLSQGVSPEVLELLRGEVMPLEQVESDREEETIG